MASVLLVSVFMEEVKLIQIKEQHHQAPRKINIDTAVLLTNAKVLIENEEKELAAGLLRKALQIDSFNISSLSLMLKCISANQIEEKQKLLKVISEKNKNFETLSDLAENYYSRSQYDLALKTYFQALTFPAGEVKKQFETYKNIGNILLLEKDFEGAEEYYYKAFNINSKSDQLLVNLGTLAIQENDFSLAQTRFREAIEINKHNDKAWVGLGLVHSHLGDDLLSLANLQTAIDIDPKNKTAVQLFAHWSLKENQWGPAIDALVNYLSLCDFDKEVSLILIHLFCLAGEMQNALLEIERFLLWEPQNTEVQQIEQQIRRHHVA